MKDANVTLVLTKSEAVTLGRIIGDLKPTANDWKKDAQALLSKVYDKLGEIVELEY